jgi:hypothetical protein
VEETTPPAAAQAVPIPTVHTRAKTLLAWLSAAGMAWHARTGARHRQWLSVCLWFCIFLPRLSVCCRRGRGRHQTRHGRCEKGRNGGKGAHHHDALPRRTGSVCPTPTPAAPTIFLQTPVKTRTCWQPAGNNSAESASLFGRFATRFRWIIVVFVG